MQITRIQAFLILLAGSACFWGCVEDNENSPEPAEQVQQSVETEDNAETPENETSDSE